MKEKEITSEPFSNMLANTINANRNIQTLLFAHLTGDDSVAEHLKKPGAFAKLVFPHGFKVELGVAEEEVPTFDQAPQKANKAPALAES